MCLFSYFPSIPTVQRKNSQALNARKKDSRKNTPPLLGCTSDTSSFRCTVKVTVYVPGRNSKTVVKVLGGEYSDNRILQWPGTPLRMVTK